jgi:ribosomal protein S18 acetylase RimI-like enzyme
MAARTEPTSSAQPAQVLDLRRVDVRRMEPLLREETAAWQRTLEWDFTRSADLVRRFVDMHALNGCALIDGGELAGYSYFVLEEHKGLIGDLYVRDRFRSRDNENLLLSRVLAAIGATRSVRRTEAQLMLFDSHLTRPVPYAGCVAAYERKFMRVTLDRANLPPARLRASLALERWQDYHQEPAANLIAACYSGHVDSLINDQYRSLAGARRFLHNIVQYPGCGAFYRPASWVAIEPLSGRLCGISLASQVASGCGHITQICVAPEYREVGAGYAMLRQSLAALRDFGCRSASLTVTATNREAVSLYERVGFGVLRQFCAYVWEGI